VTLLVQLLIECVGILLASAIIGMFVA